MFLRSVSSVLREQFFVRPRKQGQSTPLTLCDSPCFRWCGLPSNEFEATGYEVHLRGLRR